MASVDHLEQIIRQAEDLQAQGQLKQALTLVFDTAMLKRRTQTPSQERLMIKVVELCMKTENMAKLKESLAFFRNYSQNLSPSSFQKVIEEMRIRAEEQVAALAVDPITDLRDLEAEDLPDEVLASSVGPGENKSPRKSALKFLWESYKLSLDLLKANGKMVNVYDETARHALQFCITYGRSIECRHFCETLHMHLQNAIKNFRAPATGAQLSYLHDFNDSETVFHLINVQLSALEACLELNLHQEAFHVSDDLRYLMTMRKASMQHLFIYWQGLAKIFLKADQPLLHAISLHNVLFYLRKGKKELTQEQNSVVSSEVVLASLAVPNYPIDKPTINPNLMAKLASMVSSTLPTREALVNLLISRNILELASPLVKDLFNLLETEFSPLSLPAKIHPKLQELTDTQRAYIPALEKNIVLKVVGQLSTCYQSMKLERISALFSFMPATKLERVLLDFAAHSNLKIEMDYKANVIRFKETMDALGPGASLGSLVKAIQEASACTNVHDLNRERQEVIRSLWMKVREEHSEMLSALKQKQEDAERVQKEYMTDQQRRDEETKKREADERRKDEVEYEDRMRQKAIKQRMEKLDLQKREIYLEEIMSYVQKIESAQFDSKLARLGGKKVVKMSPDELLQFHPEEFSKLYHKLLEESKTEQSSELKAEQTKFEHFERAKREIEAKILRERWATEEEGEKQAMREEHLRRYQEDLQKKKAVGALAGVKERYMEREKKAAEGPFQDMLQAWESRFLDQAKERILKCASEALEQEKEEEKKAEIRRREEEKAAKLRQAESRTAPRYEPKAQTGPWRTEPREEVPVRPVAVAAPVAPQSIFGSSRPSRFVNTAKAGEAVSKPVEVQRAAPVAEVRKPPQAEETKSFPPKTEGPPRGKFINSKKGGAVTSSQEEHKLAYKQSQVAGEDGWVTQNK